LNFRVQDRGTQQAPISGLWGANGVGSLPVDSSFGVSTASSSVGLSTSVAGYHDWRRTCVTSFPNVTVTSCLSINVSGAALVPRTSHAILIGVAEHYKPDPQHLPPLVNIEPT
jgi:hypothetical protein